MSQSRNDSAKVAGATYTRAGQGYFEKRTLKRSAGIWGLWGLAVAAVISGDFSGWNFGIDFAGFGGMLIAFVILVGLIGPLIVSTNPDATVGGLYEEPQCCGPLILGADNEGQSVIANLVYGTRTSLIVGLVAGLIGTAIGVTVAYAAGRVVSSSLYQVNASDPMILGGATVIVLAIALLATTIPAFRASRLDPAKVLRPE